MSEDVEQSQNDTPPAGEYSEALLQSAIAGINARGDSVKRMACMSLPAPLFGDLCRMLLHRNMTVKAVSEWLSGQSDEAPTRSSVERFSDVLFEEYRLAQLRTRHAEAQRYVAEAAAGDPDAMQMALNHRVTELLTDEMLRADAGEKIETKRLMVLLMGARAVAQTAFDKQKMDTRIKALEKAIEKANAEIALKAQRLAQIPERVKALQAKLDDIETATAKGKRVDPGVYKALRAELVALAEAAAPPTPSFPNEAELAAKGAA